MTIEEQKALADKIGNDAANMLKDATTKLEAKAKEVAEEAVKTGGISPETFKNYQDELKETTSKFETALKQQGVTISQLEAGGLGNKSEKSLAELMDEDKADLQQIFDNRTGTKEYMLSMNKDGKVSASRVSKNNTMATTGGVTTAPNTASIVSSLTADQVLRMAGANATIIGQYRNRPWVFDLCNTTTVSSAQMLAVWINELAPQGLPGAVTPEGTLKQLRKYNYELKAQVWKKYAMLLNFTEEFGQMDFGYLEQDAVQRGVIDVINGVNAEILPRVISTATPFSAVSAAYTAPVPKNKWHAIAGMAAQVENSTFGGAMANAAVMGTGSKFEIGTQVTTQGDWLNSPQVLQGIGVVSNKDMAADAILVGDFSQYNIMLRGGMIVRTGHNGVDFAENKYSTVIEQPYFDFISDNRKTAIVSGPDFATVLAAI